MDSSSTAAHTKSWARARVAASGKERRSRRSPRRNPFRAKRRSPSFVRADAYVASLTGESALAAAPANFAHNGTASARSSRAVGGRSHRLFCLFARASRARRAHRLDGARFAFAYCDSMRSQLKREERPRHPLTRRTEALKERGRRGLRVSHARTWRVFSCVAVGHWSYSEDFSRSPLLAPSAPIRAPRGEVGSRISGG